MATIVHLSSIAPRHSMCLKPMAGLPFTSKCTYKFVQQSRTKKKQHSNFVKGKGNTTLSKLYRLPSLIAAKKNSSSVADFLSPSDTIHDFYKCINEKNLKQLGHYISKDCYIEECSYSKPLQGKKEIMNFLEQLTVAMGGNVNFRIQHVCEGDDQLIAAANWHMEWKDKKIPFTRGCSFFQCSKEGDRLIIKKAQIGIESPIKPGHLVPSLLRAIASVFDGFPRTTEWFIRSPHIIFHWIWNIYKVLLTPMTEGYVGLWNIAVRLLGYLYNIILYISKLFFK